MLSEARQKKIMEKLNRAQKCSILGPQNLGSKGGSLEPHLKVMFSQVSEVHSGGLCLGGLCSQGGFLLLGGSVHRAGFLFLGVLCSKGGFCSLGESMFPGESLRSGGGTIPETTKEDRSHPTGMLSCYILVTCIIALFID